MSTFYSLFDSCDGERVALRATRFVNRKGMAFTFIGWCKLCEKEHTVERRAPAGSFKTTQADPRWSAPIQHTTFGLKMPYSISSVKGTHFSIGLIRFEVLNDRFVRPIDPIPASWFVDLSLNVIESIEPEELEFDGADLL